MTLVLSGRTRRKRKFKAIVCRVTIELCDALPNCGSLIALCLLLLPTKKGGRTFSSPRIFLNLSFYS